MRPVVPILAQRGEFIPEVGKPIQVSLPGEVVVATVEEIFGHSSVTVVLPERVGMLGAKAQHPYRKGDIVAVSRQIDELGVEVWMPIDRHAVEMRENARRLARLEAEELQEAPALVLPPPQIGGVASTSEKEPLSDEQSTPTIRLAHRRRKKGAA